MKMKNFSVREQVLVLVTTVVLVGGGYGLLRVTPALNALKVANESAEQTEKRVRTSEIPEMPDEDEDAVNKQIREAEETLMALQGGGGAMEQRLAPPDSQELKLRISSLAQQSGIFIIENKAYVAASPLQAGTAAAPTRKSRRAKKAAAAAPPASAAPAGPTILPESDGLIARMSPGTAFQRPMQQLGMEGDFEAMRNFIKGLDRLPWQVTVVQFKLEAKPVDPPAGLPQRLSASVILAL